MIENIADWIAICETKARYCRMMDSKDWAGWADCFTEDLVLDTTLAGGYRVEGRDEAMRTVRGSIERAKTAHQVHNPEMTFDEDGQGATVIWAMNDRVRMAADKQTDTYGGHTGYGHYRERYVKGVDDKWRIRSTQLSYLHFDVHAPD